jgi:hypothetical protein
VLRENNFNYAHYTAVMSGTKKPKEEENTTINSKDISKNSFD